MHGAMRRARGQELVGVIGGAGPVASAEFVRTVYSHARGSNEQAFPAVMLDSDPRIGARSALLSGDASALRDQLSTRVQRLHRHGCAQVVICCVTLHHLLADLPADLGGLVASVVDALVDDLARQRWRVLMLCSFETKRLGLVTDHPHWPDIEHLVVWPNDRDHEALLRVIYDVKENRDTTAGRRWLQSLVDDYAVSALAVACSEVHVLAQGLPSASVIDPFDTLARAIADGTIHEFTRAHRLATRRQPARR
jgi:aspartate racemase